MLLFSWVLDPFERSNSVFVNDTPDRGGQRHFRTLTRRLE